VSSQAFVDRYGAAAIPTLLPSSAKEGLDFVPSHPKAAEALAWMGFEARAAILEVLDLAIADTDAQVRVIAYDLNEPEVVSRLERLQTRLKVIIDDSDDHGHSTSARRKPKQALSLVRCHNVKRQHPEPPAQRPSWSTALTAGGGVRLDQLQLACVLRAK
jgi:hypothetical protein